MTEPLRTSDTTEIIESGFSSELKYAKSAMQMNTEMSGIVHVHLKGVVWCRFGYQRRPQMAAIIIIW